MENGYKENDDDPPDRLSQLYCSSPKYTKYYINKNDPLKNIYQNVQFGFVEE